MKVLRISAPAGGAIKPAVLLMRSPHAREWINAMAVVETSRQFLENYRPDDPDAAVQAVVTILDHVEILVVPECNPDGARLSFFDAGQRFWRKNLRPPNPVTGCPGVDCNRNYPRYFGEAGSSSTPCTEIYHGPSALSEPETLNIAHLLEQNRNVVFSIDSHSHGQALFRPNPQGGTYVSSLPVSPADHQTYLALEAQMNGFIRAIQGTEYDSGSTSNHAGTYDEYCFFDHHVFGFDLECGRDFQPEIQEAIAAALEVAEATKALAWCATGRTGLDMEALLQRRIANAPVPLPQIEHAITDIVESWEFPDLASEERRRYLVECESKTSYPRSEYLNLMEEGFDLEDSPRGKAWTIIASESELQRLRELGYRPRVRKDYELA